MAKTIINNQKELQTGIYHDGVRSKFYAFVKEKNTGNIVSEIKETTHREIHENNIARLEVEFE